MNCARASTTVTWVPRAFFASRRAADRPAYPAPRTTIRCCPVMMRLLPFADTPQTGQASEI
ncbi:Uncharacterised protein [Mycobacteroides abscessus subsp. abscessus]|nr:Uncharacterised protein [Mycobacteroides abscessus subsp. abscessus]